MITMHCTYPDGETSECRLACSLAYALITLDDEWPDTANAADTLVDVPAFDLGGES